MTDRYADLWAALNSDDITTSAFIDPARLRALLADFDRMWAALEAIGTYPLTRGQEMSAESMREIARTALAQERS